MTIESFFLNQLNFRPKKRSLLSKMNQKNIEMKTIDGQVINQSIIDSKFIDIFKILKCKPGFKILKIRIIRIEYQLLRRIIKYIKFLWYPPSLYATKIINHFLNSRISANRDKEEGFQLIVKSLSRGLFLDCKISFSRVSKIYLSFQLILQW